MKKNKWLYVAIMAFFILGISLGITASKVIFFSNTSTYGAPVNSTFKNCPYHYINQLRCEPDLISKKKEYTTLRNDLLDFIDKEKDDGIVTNASVYFRDLENGPIVNINEQEDFAPASLLKVPLMMTYLKKAETDPSILQRKITVDVDMSSLPQQNIKPAKVAEQGKTYTIDQLLSLLITESDNTSWEVLLTDLRQNYSEDDFITTLNDLGIIDPRKDTSAQFVTVYSYASIFRLLYNSSYLNTQMSNKALQLLTQSDFQNGIIGGIPQGILVAHKFGERQAGTEQQLHDCGIVYYSPDPYLICIMTRGHTIASLEPVIEQISQQVYEAVESHN